MPAPTEPPRHLHALEAPPPDDDYDDQVPEDRAAEQAVLGAMLHTARARDTALDILTGTDFRLPAHEAIWDAITYLHFNGDPVDTLTVADQLGPQQVRRIGGDTYLAALYGDVITPENIDHHAHIVAKAATRRRLDAAGTAIRQLATTPGDLDQILDRAGTELAKATSSRPATTGPTPGLDLDAFLAQDLTEEPEWLIPDFLERRDRIIVTAAEGGGKSTLLRQWAIQTALGEHPFTGAQFTPGRVLLLDLENSDRQTRRALRPLRLAARNIEPRNLVIVCKADGLDLTNGTDVAWLDRLITAHRPDLLVTGPLYKLAGGNPNDEVDAKPAALAIDTLRERHDLAVILEAHSRKGEGGNPKNRPKEPFGWSGWMRWPEFGIHIGKDGDITHWRGQRDADRPFPELLIRGGKWPWMPAQSPDEARFHLIRKCVQDACEALSNREIARRLDMSEATVRRILGPRSQQWQAILTRIEIEAQGADS